MQTRTTSVIDLAICSADCSVDFTYSVSPSLHGSNHYLSFLTMVQPAVNLGGMERFNIKRANWPDFYRMTETDIIVEEVSVDELTASITTAIMEAATASIPKTSGRMRRSPVPWWCLDCDEAIRERTRAEQAMKRNNSDTTQTRYNRVKAKCKLIFDKCRKSSWHTYLTSINSRTQSIAYGIR